MSPPYPSWKLLFVCASFIWQWNLKYDDMTEVPAVFCWPKDLVEIRGMFTKRQSVDLHDDWFLWDTLRFSFGFTSIGPAGKLRREMIFLREGLVPSVWLFATTLRGPKCAHSIFLNGNSAISSSSYYFRLPLLKSSLIYYYRGSCWGYFLWLTQD